MADIRLHSTTAHPAWLRCPSLSYARYSCALSYGRLDNLDTTPDFYHELLVRCPALPGTETA